METSKDSEIEQLEARRATLASRENEQQERLSKLKAEGEVLKEMAASHTFHQGPQPESGPAPQSDVFASLAAQSQLERNQTETNETIAELDKTQKAMANTVNSLKTAEEERETEIKQHEVEEKMHKTEVWAETAAEGQQAVGEATEKLHHFQEHLQHFHHVAGAELLHHVPEMPEMPHVDIGGTSKYIGEAVAYGSVLADHMKTVGVDTVVKAQVQRWAEDAGAVVEYADAKIAEVGNTLGASPDHAERRNIEAEIAKHNEHADELDRLAENFKRDLATPDPVDVSAQPKDVRGEFESVVDRANQLFEQQDKKMAELQVDTATDPAVRTIEVQVRQTMSEEMILKRDEVTRELCQPVAELNVDERNARTLEDSAGLNKAHLERYGMKVANEPDGQKKLDTFASNLEQGQKDLQQELLAERPQAIEKEVTSLQGQRFPEVQAHVQALQGPGLQQSGPQQQGPAGPGQ